MSSCDSLTLGVEAENRRKCFIHLVITVHARNRHVPPVKNDICLSPKSLSYGEVLLILGALLVQDSVSITEREMVSNKK